jgi:hypothetical protein
MHDELVQTQTNHKLLENNQQQQLQRPRMPPPGFNVNHMNSYGGFLPPTQQQPPPTSVAQGKRSFILFFGSPLNWIWLIVYFLLLSSFFFYIFNFILGSKILPFMNNMGNSLPQLPPQQQQPSLNNWATQQHMGYQQNDGVPPHGGQQQNGIHGKPGNLWISVAIWIYHISDKCCANSRLW